MASVKVNGVRYDFSTLEVDISQSGESFGIVEGMDEIEYTTTINREKFYGTGRIPKQRTEGQAEYDGSLNITRYWFNYLAAKAKELEIPLARLSLTLTINYVDPATNEVVADTLTEVALGEIGNSHSQGPDHLMVSIPLDIMNIYYDGVDVFGGTL